MSKIKSQHFANGKILTFLKLRYEIVLVDGSMYSVRLLYAHLINEQIKMIIGYPSCHWAAKGVSYVRLSVKKTVEKARACPQQREGRLCVFAARLS